MKTALHEGHYIAPDLGKIRLAEWWERYRQTPSWVKLTPATKPLYESHWRNHIEPILGHRELSSLRRIGIEAWVASLMTAGVGDATINSAHRILRTLLQAAQDAEIIAGNPAKRASRPLRYRGAKERIMTPEEVNRIADAVPDTYRPLILTLAWTGLRIGEAAGLRVKNLDLLRGRISFVEAVTVVGQDVIHGDTKNKKARTVTLPGFLREELARHIEGPPSRAR
jgi:integrase